jgi:hypothetical protein
MKVGSGLHIDVFQASAVLGFKECIWSAHPPEFCAQGTLWEFSK